MTGLFHTSDTRYAYFYFHDLNEPAEITRKLGRSIISLAQEGEPALAGEASGSRWKLRSRLDLQAPLESHAKDILDQLDANKNEFVELSRELGGTMQLIEYFREHDPSLNFDSQTVSRLAEYSLRLNCNFYNFR